MKINALYILLLFLVSTCICTNGQSYTHTIPLEKKSKSFDFEYYNKLLEMQSSLGKNYEISLLSINLKNTRSSPQTDTLKLIKHRNVGSFYLAKISIGSPEKILSVTFDTGSSTILLASEYCVKNKSCLNVPFYESKKSKSFKNIPGKKNIIQIKYGIGFAMGVLGVDNFTFSSKIFVREQTFAEIVKIHANILSKGKISGIVGLGFRNDSTINKTLFESLSSQKVLKHNMIGFSYGKLSGEINFGYINANNYRGELSRHDLASKNYWAINLDNIQSTDNTVNICKKDCKVIIDSGTSGITMPRKIFEKFRSSVLLDSHCGNYHKLPNLIFTMNGIKYELTPEDYVFRFINIFSRKRYCTLNIIPVDIKSKNVSVMILGEIFMRKYYTVFDYDKKQIVFGLSSKN